MSVSEERNRIFATQDTNIDRRLVASTKEKDSLISRLQPVSSKMTKEHWRCTRNTMYLSLDLAVG